MHGAVVTQEKNVRVADPHAQLVVRVNKLLAARHPVKSDGGVDGGSGGSLDDLLRDERSKRECAGGQIYPLLPPRKADSRCTMGGESSSSSSISSTLGGHGTIYLMSFLNRSDALSISCSLLTPMEESGVSTHVPPPHLSKTRPLCVI